MLLHRNHGVSRVVTLAILKFKMHGEEIFSMKMNLEDIQKRFAQATEKEHWEKIQVLLFSEDKENVVVGMNLLETLDEEV